MRKNNRWQCKESFYVFVPKKGNKNQSSLELHNDRARGWKITAFVAGEKYDEKYIYKKGINPLIENDKIDPLTIMKKFIGMYEREKEKIKNEQ